MPTETIYTAERIFTGKDWLEGHAVVTSEGLVQKIIPLSSLNSSQQVQQFGDCLIAPAFIDLQIYGATSRLFAVYPNEDALKKLVGHCREGGTGYCLPTVATNEKETVIQCIDAIRNYWAQDGEGILGIHLEGPWLNPLKKGAHIASLIHPPTLEEVNELLQYGKGVIRIITLAPEVCSEEIIDTLIENDILLSAGHSNSTYQQAKASFARGVSLVTHLFNAMSSLHHREPGLAGAAMEDDNVMASIIPDGHHVDYPAVKIAKKAMGDRLFAITDAVTETDKGYYKHKLEGDKYEADGILSGSALTMNQALKNLVRFVHIDLDEALRMCTTYPAKAIRQENVLGAIAAGSRSDMVVLNEELDLVQLIK